MTDTDTRDLAEHEHTYAVFIRLTKWSAASVAVLLILMATFLLHH